MSINLLATRWWTHVQVDPDNPSGCWRWTGSTFLSGYGRIMVEGTLYRAHRLALIVAGVDVPEDAFVCHHCDTKWCVNPAHLYVGDATSNNRDTVARGRWRERSYGYARGETQGSAKLTETDVLVIRSRCQRGDTQKAVADDFGLGQSQVGRIVRGESWAWLSSGQA